MKGFFKTVAMVTVFSVCEKFLGFMYRIYMSRTIGSEGVGIYQVSLSVFAFLLTLTCSGTPITVSRLMTKYKSENRPDLVRKVITAGIVYTFFVALFLCLIFVIFKNQFSFIFADKRCMTVFLIVLPGLIFTSIYSILRGVFWGNKDFLPYSVIELLEELVMIVSGVFLINCAVSPYDGAKRAGLAVLISYIFSFTLSTITFFIRKNKLSRPKEQFKILLKTATPINAMRTVNSLSTSLVSIILPIRLVAIGMSESQAMSLYGAAAGEALPILYIPTTLIGSFILVLVPEISENYYRKNYTALKNDIEKSLKFTTALSLLFVPVFFVCGEEIGILIFNSYECGKYLKISAFLVLFMGISNISASTLDSMGKEKSVLIFYLIGGALMLVSVYVLPGLLGIYSLVIGFSTIFGITTLLNMILLYKVCPVKPKYVGFLLKSVALIIPTIIFGGMLEKLLLPLLGTFLTFVSCTAIMLVFNGLLYIGFNIIDVNVIKAKLPKIKRLKEKTA